MPRAKAVNHHYFDELNERSAWMLGFWAADGSLVMRGRTCQIAFYQKDRSVLEAIKTELGSEHAIARPARANALVFSSKHMGERLHAIFGMDDLMSKSNRIAWPSLLPESLFWHFLRGWSDGDGHIRSSRGANRFMIVSGSRRILDVLASKLLSRTGIRCSVRAMSSAHLLSCCGINAKVIVQQMYLGATIWCPARRKQADALMAWKAPQVPRNISEDTARMFPDLIRVSLAHGASNSESGFYGVRQVESGRWIAKVGGQYQGTYDTPIVAAKAHDHIAIEKYGPCAILNFT